MVYRQAVTIVTTTVLVLAVSGSDKDMQPEPNSNLYIFELDHQVLLDDSQPVNSQLFHLVWDLREQSDTTVWLFISSLSLKLTLAILRQYLSPAQFTDVVIYHSE